MALIPSWFWRGGVCKALIFRRSDLPKDRSAWQPLFAAAMGSPDPYSQQLNGMGGGIPALSKVCVVSPSRSPDADVNFEFVQVVVDDGSLDLASNCGNMTGAIGPFALDQGVFRPAPAQLQADPKHATVRIFNTNTNKIIVSTFPIVGRPPRFEAKGEYTMKGIPGTASKIALSFLSPGGTQTGSVLPCGGSRTTTLNTKDKQGRGIKVSLVDIANPGVFVDGAELGLTSEVTPAELDLQADVMALLENVRREGAEKMLLDPNVASVPKVVVLFTPSAELIATGVNIKCIALSMGKAHKGIPLTLALNLGAACQMEGTIAFDLSRQLKGGDVIIQHPGGTIDVGADIVKEEVHSASLYSTARLLMQGEVNIA
jgi:2-methylaconitate cis-trans-isomerase PrpF